MALKPVSVLLLVALAVVSTHALTQGEETALLAFLNAWPILASQTPTWNTSASLACTPPVFYGVECSYGEDTHITSIVLNGLNLTGSIPSEVNGLQWLRVLSFEESCLSDALSEEIEELDNLTSYTVTDLPLLCDGLSSRKSTIFPPDGVMESMENLTIVMASLDSFVSESIVNWTSLQRLRLASPYYGTQSSRPPVIALYGLMPDLGQLHALKSLILEGTGLQGFEERKSAFPDSLEEFSVARSPGFEFKLESLLSSCLKLRYLDYSGTRAQQLSLDLTAPPLNLQYFCARSVSGSFTMQNSFWSLFPNLRQLVITNAKVDGRLSADLGGMRHLELLDLSGSSFSGYIPPSIGNCTSLAKLVFQKMRLKGSIPTSICQIGSALRHLEISDVKTGGSPIPDCIGDLTALESLSLQTNGHTGTIPLSIGRLRSLSTLRLDHNALTGELPTTSSTRLFVVNLESNQLSGSIPPSLAAHVKQLELSYNSLSGTIPSDLFMAAELTTLDVSHNGFTGSLPRFPRLFIPSLIDASHNSFEGAVPAEYRHSGYLELSFNSLTSLTPLLTNMRDQPAVTMLAVGDNLLREEEHSLDFQHFTRLVTLSLRNNRFNRLLPHLPPGLEYLDASNNRFTTDNIIPWAADTGSLVYLDLASNGFSFWYPMEPNLFFGSPTLGYLSLAHNDLRNLTGFFPKQPRPSLTVLDLTDTKLGSVLPRSFRVFPNLAILKLGSNDFVGELDIEELLSVVQLDISFNRFEIDASKFSSMPRLVSLTANDNRIHGTLVLDDMPNLESANFSSNLLDDKPDLVTIGTAVHQSPLKVLDISNNPIPIITSFDSNRTGLTKSSSSSPSNVSADSVTCYALSFWNRSTEFAFNEDLFGYAQCECSQGYFGAPPLQCLKCPSRGTTSCGLSSARISSGAFMYIAGNDTFSPATPSSKPNIDSSTRRIVRNFVDTFEDAFPTLFATLFTGNASLSTPNLSSSVILATETCLLTPVQTQSGQSNCKGGLINGDRFSLPGYSLPAALDIQCAEGSTGRLCSRCICAPHANDTTCWFESGAHCKKCNRIFSLSTSLPVFFALVFLAVIVLSIIMAVILRRKRSQSRIKFEELSLLKRIFYRLMYLKSLGNLSILIMFLQTLIAFTGWDTTARLSFLALLNGKTKGLGLWCFFPMLSDPLWTQLVELSVPFVVSIVTVLSVIIGGIAASLKFKSSKSDLNDGSTLGEDALLLTAKQEIAVEYPTTALATSLVITVVKFFYFGTALTAHEYLFSTRQAATGIRFIQSHPFMKSADAWNLIVASIPAILIFDLVIPLCFVAICWRVRNTFRQPSVRIYYGSIFETYRDGCFWWEIVNTLKKLAIALVLKALPPTDAVQSTLIATILLGSTLVQLLASPWKRKLENIADGVSSLLLVGSLLATRPGNLEHTSEVLWYLRVLSLLFVIASVGILILQMVTGKTDYEKLLDEFEGQDAIKGQVTTIEEGNLTDSWHPLDAPLNS